VFKYLRQAPSRPFDVVFADPPFDLENRSELPGLILGKGWLKPGGWFILEHPSSEDNEYELSGIDNRRYGNCSFAFFQEQPQPESGPEVSSH
jgi:16S rRNA G966 N2-methylase RsmD